MEPRSCKRCKAKIQFIRTAAGKLMPCDMKPAKVVTEAGDVISGFIPHWATCPYADEFRSKK